MDMHQDKYIRAAARVAEIRKFYGKIGKLALFILFLLAFNYFVYELRGTWFLWIIGFVSLSIVIQAYKLFGPSLIFGKDWEQRKIEEEMRKEDHHTFYS